MFLLRRYSRPASFRLNTSLRFSTSSKFKHNPLGLPNANRPPPTIPRRGGAIEKRPIPHVRHVIAVASGKGGVGKSTVAANLAVALAQGTPSGGRPRVGLLDLDIFGPSVPKLMGLEGVAEPRLTKGNAIIPYQNHGLQCMSIGFLLPPNEDAAVVWRGLMVQKATQQLLFDVDWRGEDASHPGLDVLVIDMPPGTGDVQLTLSQLVNVDGAVIVSTPQDVALIDARKGVSMFRKVDVPIFGLLLNMSHFTCPTCTTPHHIFGPLTSFHQSAEGLSLEILGELPVVPTVSKDGDSGRPTLLRGASDTGLSDDLAVREVRATMNAVARKIWDRLLSKGSEGRRIP